ncbi:MAG TPA: DUF3090 domain-containing protein [Acidimicrobiales bacterium]
MSESFDFPAPERITVGAVGPPGQRVFLLQASDGSDHVTLKVEKAQVSALATHLGRVLTELTRPAHMPEDLELAEPAEPAWVVGSLGIGYDEDNDRILLLAEEAVGEDAEGAVARFALTREAAAALAVRGTRLVEAGRPPCPLCGYPLDPSGHACPRTNGNRPPTL